MSQPFHVSLPESFFSGEAPSPKKKSQGNHSCGSVLLSDGPMQKSWFFESFWLNSTWTWKKPPLLLGAGDDSPKNVSIIPSFQWCQRSDRSDQSHPNDVISTSPLLVLVTHKLGWKPPAGSLDHPTGEIWKTLVFMNTSTKYSTSQVQDWVIACTYGILWGSKLHNFG